MPELTGVVGTPRVDYAAVIIPSTSGASTSTTVCAAPQATAPTVRPKRRPMAHGVGITGPVPSPRPHWP